MKTLQTILTEKGNEWFWETKALGNSQWVSSHLDSPRSQYVSDYIKEKYEEEKKYDEVLRDGAD